MYQHSALSLLLEGEHSSYRFFDNTVENIFSVLVKNGADVNVVYPEKLYKPAFKEDDVEDETYNPKGPYYCTPLISVIRSNSSYNEVKRHNL